MDAFNSDSAATGGRRAGRPRSEACRQAILRAAYDLLGETGLSGFTIERVAARSGTARTTVYRWWRSKGALAVDALMAAIAPELAVPRTASAVADIKAQMRLLARTLTGPPGVIIRSIIAEAQSDTDTAQAFLAGYVLVRRNETKALLDDAVALGELPTALDREATIDALFGPLYHRLLLRIGELDDAWVERVCEVVLGGVRARAHATTGSERAAGG